jgi:hypothetical protein
LFFPIDKSQGKNKTKPCSTVLCAGSLFARLIAEVKNMESNMSKTMVFGTISVVGTGRRCPLERRRATAVCDGSMIG